MKLNSRRFLLVVGLLLMAGCAQQSPYLHKAETHKFNGLKVAVLPPEITVNELGVASAEEVPEWTEQGTRNVQYYLSGIEQTASGSLDLTQIKVLPEEHDLLLEQHLALYERLSMEYLSTHKHPAWSGYNSKLSIGTGLAGLKEHVDADAVLVVIGHENISSGGRKTTFVLAAMMGVAIPMGHAFVHAGLIDLDSGEVLWTNTAVDLSASFLKPSSSSSLLERTFEGLPVNLPAGR